MGEALRTVTVVVIGAGQAGLSAAYHLQRRGFTGVRGAGTPAGVSPAADAPEQPASMPGTFVVLDANSAPGGAWQHRWKTLTMATVNGIFDLPGQTQPPVDPAEASRTAVSRSFAGYERDFALPVHRPVRVTAVRRADADPHGPLLVESDRGTWVARHVINATGTWDNPLSPHYPGQELFRGRQLHTRDYRDAAEFAGLRVAIVGGGISALQLLEEISRDATTLWYTRRDPVFLEDEFMPETTGRAVIAKVTADAEAGRPGRSVVSYTGLAWTSYALKAKARGVLAHRPMFTAIEAEGLREADGSFTPVDVILWATGFRPAIAHLEPLELRGELGGVPVSGTRAVREPRLHLIGFGPSQSTIGANRAGRAAVIAIARELDAPSASVFATSASVFATSASAAP
ncbi:NAD(P)-binding domain-containing protein [Microbacterium betulae]|uniref:NAD(P)-binding domain-containing protein n=1 Tax=Microbacterium betulae TaxID=2981139 RepID=A0AA97FIX5_9MICO|nr:NAD(P)-binding domain-containing protein [Microbacterium sp. AB]WOF24098.1 NAD(P)-binding domain-containing protein [Microbacterium sp. AB]